MREFETVKEVRELVCGLDPQCFNSAEEEVEGHGCFEGHGYVDKSMFFVGHHCVFWIVTLKDNRTYAYKELPPESLDTFAPLILQSKQIFVEFTRHHHIVKFTAIQEKEGHPHHH